MIIIYIKGVQDSSHKGGLGECVLQLSSNEKINSVIFAYINASDLHQNFVTSLKKMPDSEEQSSGDKVAI